MGITVDIEKIYIACESAKQNPAEENLFRQLRLNQWVKQSVRWMPMEKWDKCAYTVNPESLVGRVCYGGLDLSSTTDITAFVLVFPPEYEGDKYIMEFMQEDCDYNISEIRSVLASMGFKQNDIGKSLSVLSGGEIIKLLLAKMLMGRYNILLMDEPSNFLDIPSL